ncbi:MAG: class I SAM-dependent methyltransferase [Bacteroidales bacterium]
MSSQWYERLFRNYARKYEEEEFTKGTLGECDFIEAEADSNKNTSILDIGCGTGRHSIELARRGYRVTGLDLSESMLAVARSRAVAEKLDIRFIQADARSFSFPGEFGLAIMLCEGAFPLMETDAMNFRILQNAAAALKPCGKLIFTTLNGLFPLFHSVKDFLESNKGTSPVTNLANNFDLMTFRDHSTITLDDDSGTPMELQCNERYYVPSEIRWLLESLGFNNIHIGNARLGAFSRQNPLTTEDFEMLVIAEKIN